MGLPADISTEIEAGEPDGPVTVALVSDDVTEPSFNPNGEPARTERTEDAFRAAAVAQN